MDYLNVHFPFGKPKEMTSEQMKWMSDFVSIDKRKISVDNEDKLIEIYNFLFNTDLKKGHENVTKSVEKKLYLIWEGQK